jgi:hypothetical protein
VSVFAIFGLLLAAPVPGNVLVLFVWQDNKFVVPFVAHLAKFSLGQSLL